MATLGRAVQRATAVAFHMGSGSPRNAGLALVEPHSLCVVVSELGMMVNAVVAARVDLLPRLARRPGIALAQQPAIIWLTCVVALNPLDSQRTRNPDASARATQPEPLGRTRDIATLWFG
jgi:hypothetical protein